MWLHVHRLVCLFFFNITIYWCILLLRHSSQTNLVNGVCTVLCLKECYFEYPLFSDFVNGLCVNRSFCSEGMSAVLSGALVVVINVMTVELRADILIRHLLARKLQIHTTR